MPKTVDHVVRRRELADAAIRVIARDGLAAITLGAVAEDAGWSIGSIRYYFPAKNDLLAAALERVGERVDERIRDRTGGAMGRAQLRIAMVEMLPLDPTGAEESRVWLAFLAQAAVDAELVPFAEQIAERLHQPLAEHIAAGVQAGEFRADLDAAHEATRLQLLRDALDLALSTTPGRASRDWALSLLDEHLHGLTAR